MAALLYEMLMSEADIPPGPEAGGYHKPSKCAGQFCVFHNPSKHGMVDWPKVIRSSALVERTCPHGVGHPDPDSLAWLDSIGRSGYGVHGCDGCCTDKGD